MSASLRDKLEQSRRERFVGRLTERDLLRDVLSCEELPFFVLHIFGPGGIGKTSLMHEYAAIARAAGVRVALLDGRSFEPSPDSFLRALSAALALPDGSEPAAFLSNLNRRVVILLDTYELQTPLDGWLRETFLPSLPADILVIFAGRYPPSVDWRTDAGWQQMMRILSLRNLSPEEGRHYLTRRRLPDRQIERVLEFTHGHPLALSLVADVYDQRPGTDFRPEVAPDVIKTLLDQLVRRVPSSDHRAALEACALVRQTTEPLLAAMLEIPDAHELFAWLRGLSFIESDRHGLMPHDLAREALATDVRWRNPDLYVTLHTRARGYYMQHVRQGSPQEQRRLLADYVFLHRDNPSVRPFFLWQESGTIYTDVLRPGDAEHLIAMVRAHEGATSAGIAAHWFARQPENVSVLRRASGDPVGFVARVTLEQTTDEDRALDPALPAVGNVLGRNPLRRGETATLFRFWMARDTYQSVSVEQSRLFLNIVQHYLITPGLAYTFLPCAEPEFWRPAFTYADLERLPEADFSIDERRYGVYGHDWRITPPPAWLELLAERELGGEPTRPTERSTPPLIVLSEAAFAASVRDALRDYVSPTSLAGNPLTRSRLVRAVAGADAAPAVRAVTLRALLKETAETLLESPKTARFYRALHHTYLQPASTQEQAAELLDLPFSTYRRHLRSGIEEVTARLWAREIANLEG